MLWACIALPQLAIDGVLRHHPDPNAPLALITGPAQRRVLHAVNAAAAAHGLRAGQSLAAAQVLLADFEMVNYRAGRRAAGAACGPGVGMARPGRKPVRGSNSEAAGRASNPHGGADALRWQAFLAAWAYRYSSRVSIDFPDAVVLEIGASLGLFGPWPAFERRLRNDLDALGFHHRIAVAPTARAAWVLAEVGDGAAIGVAAVPAIGEAKAVPAYGLRPKPGYRAPSAGPVARFEAQRETGRATLERALAVIPVTRARIEPLMAQALHGMGLRQLGQLFVLPRDALARRFGSGLLLHLDRLRGRVAEPMEFYRPPDRFDVRLELSYEVENTQALLFPLRRLIADLTAYLAGRDGGVQRFALRLEHESHPASVVHVGLLAAERDAGLLFDLARGRLEQARVAAPVQAMRLVARELPPFVPGGRELFDARPAQSVPWQSLRERLRARLGEDAVYGLALANNHRPERAARRVAAVVPAYGLRPKPGYVAPSAARFEAQRKTGRLGAKQSHSDPLDASTMGELAAVPAYGLRPKPGYVAPSAARFEAQRKTREMALVPRPTWLLARPIPLRGPTPKILAGPERLETGWWDGADVRRDYYLVETASGQRAWVFCAPGEHGPFMLHGWFA